MNKTNIIEHFFQEHYSSLCSFAYKIIDSQEVARDIVQDAFVYVMEHPKLLEKEPNTLKSYLYSAVKNATLNHLRHKKVIVKSFEKNPFVELEEEVITKKMMEAEVAHKLYNALLLLPKGCQEICRLSYLEGHSNKQISEMLNISINTVKTQKMRALSLLRKKIPLAELLSLFAMFANIR